MSVRTIEKGCSEDEFTPKMPLRSLDEIFDPFYDSVVRPSKLGLAASDSGTSPLRGHSLRLDGCPKDFLMFAPRAFIGFCKLAGCHLTVSFGMGREMPPSGEKPFFRNGSKVEVAS
jgi:hypothetical protein